MTFLEEVKKGFSAKPKRIPSKFFYDQRGDELFQAIMRMPEYYLPEMETDLLKKYSTQIAAILPKRDLKIIELGAGDGSKVVWLLKGMEGLQKVSYFGLDISESVLRSNKGLLKKRFLKSIFRPYQVIIH